MTTEEKAKAYDEALERAREWYNNPNSSSVGKAYLYAVFSELKENEDERIRMWLIGYFRQYKEDGIEKYANGLKVESIIAWLEKQAPKWSEEDSLMIDKIIDYMRPMPIFFESTKGKSGKEYTKEFVKNATKWLKLLKQRMEEQ